MANTFTTTVDPPNPLYFSVGQPLLADGTGRGGDLLESHNWCHAHGGAQNVIEQCFGDGLLTKTAVLPAAGTYHLRWPFPMLNAAFTSVRVHVFAEHAGAVGGSVRFESFTAAAPAVVVDTETIAIPPGAAAWHSGVAQLTVTGTGGYAIVGVAVAGDGADETIVHTVVVDWLPKTSALPAGAAGNFTPFDADERDADSVCSADVGRRLIDNQAELMARQQSYLQWSGIVGISEEMEEIEHTAWVPVRYDALTKGYTITFWADVEGLVGDSILRIYVNDAEPGHPGTFIDTYEIAVAGGAARAIQTKTIALHDRPRLEGCPHPFTRITVYPGTRTTEGVGGFGSAESGRQQNDGVDSPIVYGISAWGV